MEDLYQDLTCNTERRMRRRNALPNVMEGIEPNQLRNLGVRIPLLGLVNNDQYTNDGEQLIESSELGPSECFVSILYDNNELCHQNEDQSLDIDSDMMLNNPCYRRRRNALPDALAILDDKSRQKISTLGSKHRAKHGLRPW